MRVTIIEAYPYELQPMNPEKKEFFQPIRSQDLTVTPKIEKLPKMRFGKIKVNTPVLLPHVITGKKKQEKIYIIMVIKVTHKYNTISRFNHVTVFKNSPKLFKMVVIDAANAHIGSDYISHTDPKKMEPLEHHIHCETAGKIIGYRDSVNMDAPV